MLSKNASWPLLVELFLVGVEDVLVREGEIASRQACVVLTWAMGLLFHDEGVHGSDMIKVKKRN